MSQVDHVPIAQVPVSSKLLWNRVQVFQLSDIIGAHESVLQSDGIAIHPALVVASEEPVDVELHEQGRLLIL